MASPSSTEPARKPKLHLLQLHESPVRNGDDYERFDWQWILINDNQNSFGITAYDVVCIPDLMSGAGEFEGVRFVGDLTESGWPLWKAGIEYPEFPSVIAQQGDLRVKYQDIFDAIMGEVHCGRTFADLMGDDEAVAQFWASPKVSRRRRAAAQEWHIPLSRCALLNNS
jgi:hypothetical protein